MNTRSYVAASRRSLLAAALGAAMPLPALAQAAPRAPRNVLATVAMVGDVVREISGGRIRAETLIGEGVDPHLFRPTRADIARLLSADAVFASGHRLEGRMGDVLDRVRGAGKPVILIAESLPRDRLRANPDYPDSADPHVWMDPSLWSLASVSAAEALGRLAPDLRETFADNLEKFRARLARLDAYARDSVATIPANARVLVTAHDAFAYFGARYGLEVESIQGLSTEAEANLAAIEALVRKLVDRRVPAVFAETSVPDRAVRALIEGAGARGQRVALGGNLFSDAMGRPGSYEGTYEGMIDHNVTIITRALGGQAPARGLNGRLAG
ncbi:metal ABC transporter solute-binding protein, Zn/Mn family [Falsiroseomonas stagni]|uniref:Manganese/zinc/iron transport system substrate-binding protein n=1 Tax=Falsiroseomonas stagni DSM 19981 TaxID=1123062 RepID=A0A1I4DUA9_9PROT|nr:zinc ABC transporter substrate-binding protein [Falsiroseomonas stagni]SFK97202.1 manganese/zinc/iron transport system substrate-binding protein [Falsiroseomonas stagni DSM 19981]